MRLNHPQSGKLQQGAVVNCIAVPGYENCDCHGIVLTARCDLEHEKHSVINYLPIVRFSDWVPRRMCYIVAKRLRKSLDSSISRVLAQKGVSDFVRDIFPLEDIITHETKANERKSLLQKCSHLKLVEEVLALDGAPCSKSKDLFGIDKSLCDTVVKELIQQKLGEYYFLGAAEVLDTNSEGHVILLRHMQTMSLTLMQKIISGLTEDEAKHDAEASSWLSFRYNPICMTTGVLRSPEIEHLGQQFANLFVRIGVDDYKDETIEHHFKIVQGF